MADLQRALGPRTVQQSLPDCHITVSSNIPSPVPSTNPSALHHHPGILGNSNRINEHVLQKDVSDSLDTICAIEVQKANIRTALFVSKTLQSEVAGRCHSGSGITRVFTRLLEVPLGDKDTNLYNCEQFVARFSGSSPTECGGA
jgi:hypothetical protein